MNRNLSLAIMLGLSVTGCGGGSSSNTNPSDSDNDGVVDSADAFPQDSSETKDSDGDGVGDNADQDDDNDGVIDSEDAFPFDDSESKDTDGDGIGNNADQDDDNDGVVDVEDAFPLDDSETLDTDNDGVGNNADTDDDGDGVADTEDAFPLDSTESADTDGDGIGNNADEDDDNDGVPDTDDAFPLDNTESLDTDGDGIGNNADEDDDNDGVPDSEDLFPLDNTESVDTDGDGVGNNADLDDDGDGVPDSLDEFPLDPARAGDSDGDGIDDVQDSDDDNDGYTDNEEIKLESDPQDANSRPQTHLWRAADSLYRGNSFQPIKLNSEQFYQKWQVVLPTPIESTQNSGLIETNDQLVLTGDTVISVNKQNGEYKFRNEVKHGSSSPFLLSGKVAVKSSVRAGMNSLTSARKMFDLNTGEVAFDDSDLTFYYSFNQNNQYSSVWDLNSAPRYQIPGLSALSFGRSSITFTVDEENLYTFSLDQGLVSVDLTTGENVFDRESNAKVVGAPILGYSNDVYTVGALDWPVYNTNNYNVLYAVDITSGNIKWQVPTQTYTQVASSLNKVFFFKDNQLIALYPENGEQLWQFSPTTGEVFNVHKIVATLSHVFVSTQSNTYAIDTNTGQIAWSTDTGGDIIIGRDSVLYIRSYQTVGANTYQSKSLLSAIDLNAALTDSDGDGIYDSVDNDDDNDGVSDPQDAFPLDSGESVDTDLDGIGNNADEDDDGDGLLDTIEQELGIDPLKVDSDGDKLDDKFEVDSGLDPKVANGKVDTDNDGYTDIAEYFLGHAIDNADDKPSSLSFTGRFANSRQNSFVPQLTDLSSVSLQSQLAISAKGLYDDEFEGSLNLKNGKLLAVPRLADDIELADITQGQSLWTKRVSINGLAIEDSQSYLADDRVYFAAQHHFVDTWDYRFMYSTVKQLAIDDGSELASVQIDQMESMTEVEGDWLAVAEHGFIRYSLPDMIQQWSIASKVVSTIHDDINTAVTDGNHLYYLGESFGLTKVAVDGSSHEKGQSTIDSMYLGANVLGHRGLFFATAGPVANRKLLAFDTSSLKIKWQVAVGQSGVRNTPAAGLGEVYQFGDNTLKAYNSHDGTFLWQFELAQDEEYGGQMIITPDHIFVATDKRTFALNASSQTIDWEVNHVGALAMNDGKLVIATTDQYYIYDIGRD